ncbi:2Fe-2S iron-sulfur cluster binding domain-containing protein [Solimonas aquatica]|uniref:2Fe-2S iron-sulfur cluster binding domain-containing protein n=1 Tax=Solimonas aquatica TaxID=489703 RepID=A0A1H9BGU0_9GAMM|nr:2Fe-2S iron-sulfur cluster-binding protein [Solimonas aquatica]SEP88230.1 2Fe-2S iron-sulfur cluster binding domain-containing protein [Solimonas aquatica]
MRHYRISVEGLDEPYRCAEGQTLLGCLELRPRRPITVGCRGGGCGVCKVEIVSGQYTSRRMSRDHISSEEQASGVVLACRVQPRSDMVLRVIGLLRKRFSPCGTTQVAGLPGDATDRMQAAPGEIVNG